MRGPRREAEALMAGPSVSGEKLRKERVYERRGGRDGKEAGDMCCMIDEEASPDDVAFNVGKI